MSLYQRSLLDIESLSLESIRLLFQTASELLQSNYSCPGPSKPTIAALLFFEPSTRTRLSFEVAAVRLGLQTVRIDEAQSTSLVKGETLKDTLLNVIAMGPEVIVLRYGEDPELSEYLPHSPVPILMAGQGVRSHPSQALLDAFTIERELGPLAQQRILLVGDIKHSRVAASNLKLFLKMGAQVAITGPRELLPQTTPLGVQIFSQFEQGLQWASVCMMLRIQQERLTASTAQNLKPHDYRAEFALTQKRLEQFSSSGIFMHPGPINQNMEIDANVLVDPRSRILEQVKNGVAIRAGLLAHCLGLKEG